jgi:uncharacterized membrane-anchored protein
MDVKREPMVLDLPRHRQEIAECDRLYQITVGAKVVAQRVIAFLFRRSQDHDRNALQSRP